MSDRWRIHLDGGAPVEGGGEVLPLIGLSFPAVSAFDPPASGEGSIDPVGLAAISDRLADLLVPGLRARMRRVRFITAMAVGSLACEPLADEPPADGASTPAICFEWLVVEAFVRRLHHGLPHGVPGSQKARGVLGRSQRLSASTYLKGPAVFGFNGVYKPFAIDSGVVGAGLEPGLRCAELTRRWEHDQGLAGFTDEVPRTEGGRLRERIGAEVRAALRSGHCTTSPGSQLLGQLAHSLRPDTIGTRERHALRAILTDGEHDTRAELAHHIATLTPRSTRRSLLRPSGRIAQPRWAESSTRLSPTNGSQRSSTLLSGHCAPSLTRSAPSR